MSLFIAELAYADPAIIESAKIGIFAGSLVAGVAGALILGLRRRRPSHDDGVDDDPVNDTEPASATRDRAATTTTGRRPAAGTTTEGASS